ncbi:MAG: diaminopimelate decarboxylase [Bacillota bacterium]|nr:diaminopimelate decarboxylase [Bacillota bacterium]
MFISDCLSVNGAGHLTVGGLDTVELAREYGTPLYIMDEEYIRSTCRAYKSALREGFGSDRNVVAYASKAFCCAYMYRILKEEGCGADIVSGGELYTAIKAGFPADRLFFHGNNKTDEELEMALRYQVGRIIVDNREELIRLDSLARKYGKIAQIIFRINPGIDAHTHQFLQTGQIDSKFGVPIETGEAYELIKDSLKYDNLKLAGVHCHIGSQIFDSEPFYLAAKKLMEFVAKIRDELGYEISDIDIGGGFGIKYLPSHDPKTPAENLRAASEAIKKAAAEHRLSIPRVIIEPGRAIVGPAGVTVYKVGSVKEIRNVRTYVSVDGGMSDNPRYALYGSEYEVLSAANADGPRAMLCTVAGKCCESGDIIAKDVLIQKVKPGDFLAVLTTGAYNYSMASNYNRNPRPPVVMVRNGKANVAVKRESYDDLIHNDVF